MTLDKTPAATDARPFWIGGIRVEPRLNQVTNRDKTAAVEHLTMRVLMILAANPGEPVSREMILESVWADSAPNDEGLTQAICKLRKLLGDSPGQSNVIQTIRKIGYRLVAPVSYEPPIAAAALRTRHEGSEDIPLRGIRIRLSAQQLIAAVGAMTALLLVFELL